MSSNTISILIPALKKNVAFQDDLVKKLSGVALIQRAINKALEIGVKKSDVYVLTDSEEIKLIANRNGVQFYLEPTLVLSDLFSTINSSDYLYNAAIKNKFLLLLSPYAPMLTVDMINSAKQTLINSNKDILKPVKQVKRHLYDNKGQSTIEALFGSEHEVHIVESKAFVLLRSDLLRKKSKQYPSIIAWQIDNDMIEIESYQDWWVCEKLLGRKRIVFRVIGNKKVGMGHIYRALSLAHEITDHEILFVSDSENTDAVNKLAGYDYWLGIYEINNIVENIISLNPDLVVNDILSTTEADVLPLQQRGIKVINFEDLGVGAKLSNLTINELYDNPQFDGKNILWGHQYFFVRDEFHDAKPHRFKKYVDSVLLTFGGTDQLDLSYKVYKTIAELCESRNIQIHIVTGAGYAGYKKLEQEIKNNTFVTLTKETGVISSIMEQSQLAIVSNGRTLYELAHMNIPAIVISQHEREQTHSFACEENGFVPLGVFDNKNTESKVLEQLTRLFDDVEYRRKLFECTLKYRFNANKKKVLKRMLALLPCETGVMH